VTRQTIATDDPARQICLSATRLRCANTAERIEVLFGVKTLGGPRNVVLDGGSRYPATRGKGSSFQTAFVKLLWPLAIALGIIMRYMRLLPAMLDADIVFGVVRPSVCLSAQYLENYRSETDITWYEFVPR